MREMMNRLRKQFALRSRLRAWRHARAMRRELDPRDLLWDVRNFAPRRAEAAEFRINLVVFSLEPQDRFGGIETSLALLAELGRWLPRLRIVVTLTRPSAAAMAKLEGFVAVSAREDAAAERQVVFVGDGEAFPVGLNDIFLTHGWWEARRARGWTAWQAETFGGRRHPLLLMLQEFEPGFYAMSARSALAEETLRNPGPHVAIFNTAVLAEYFRTRGYQFERSLVFEPRLHPGLARKLGTLRGRAKERVLFCYGRPGVERNAFELVALGLREWARIFPDAKTWRVVSAGTEHRPVRVSSDHLVIASGKLPLDDYAELIGRSAVGLSLMISPHPSYPPLELAHFGVRVATNRYASKEPAAWHDNLHAAETLEPEAIGRLLARLCAEAQADPQGGWRGVSRMPDYLAGSTPFGFAEELARSLREPEAAARTKIDFAKQPESLGG